MLVLGRKEIPARWFLPHPARRTRANRRASGWACGVAAETVGIVQKEQPTEPPESCCLAWHALVHARRLPADPRTALPDK